MIIFCLLRKSYQRVNSIFGSSCTSQSGLKTNFRSMMIYLYVPIVVVLFVSLILFVEIPSSSYVSVLFCCRCCRATAVSAIAMLLWPTITEQLHRTNNIHHNLETSCPTAKTGVLGGGAFLSLDSCLFLLVALMLADNARADFFGESEDVSSGSSFQPNLVKATA